MGNRDLTREQIHELLAMALSQRGIVSSKNYDEGALTVEIDPPTPSETSFFQWSVFKGALTEACTDKESGSFDEQNFELTYRAIVALAKENIRFSCTLGQPIVMVTNAVDGERHYAKRNWSQSPHYQVSLDIFNGFFEKLDGDALKKFGYAYGITIKYAYPIHHIIPTSSTHCYVDGWTSYDKYNPALTPAEARPLSDIPALFRKPQKPETLNNTNISLQEFATELMQNVRYIVLETLKDYKPEYLHQSPLALLKNYFQHNKKSAPTSIGVKNRNQAIRELLQLSETVLPERDDLKRVSEILSAEDDVMDSLMQFIVSAAADSLASGNSSEIRISTKRLNSLQRRDPQFFDNLSNCGLSTAAIKSGNLGCQVTGRLLKNALLSYEASLGGNEKSWEHVLLNAAMAAWCNVKRVPELESAKNVTTPVTKISPVNQKSVWQERAIPKPSITLFVEPGC